MKKYIAPEVEIKKFNVENIMAESGVTVATSATAADALNAQVSDTVDYNTLFGLSN